jgi:hypothetical protein
MALAMLTEEQLEGTRPGMRRPELDLRAVTLAGPVDEWPTGTHGVIVDAFVEVAMVEIADESGQTLELLTVGYESLVLL